MDRCTHECPKDQWKDRYINPKRDSLGLRGFWIKVNNGSTEMNKVKINGNPVTYYTIPSLNEVVNIGDFSLFIYLYTPEGLYLIKHSTSNMSQIRTDFFQDVDMFNEDFYDEEAVRERGDRPIGIGHSSFFSNEEYKTQYEYGQDLSNKSVEEINLNCDVKYAGELLYYKPSYLSGNGVVVYWSNGSGHFRPKPDSPCKNELFLEIIKKGLRRNLKVVGGYFPEELFVQENDATNKKENIDKWCDIENPKSGLIPKNKGKRRKSKSKSKRRKSKKSRKKKTRRRSR